MNVGRNLCDLFTYFRGDCIMIITYTSILECSIDYLETLWSLASRKDTCHPSRFFKYNNGFFGTIFRSCQRVHKTEFRIRRRMPLSQEEDSDSHKRRNSRNRYHINLINILEAQGLKCPSQIICFGLRIGLQCTRLQCQMTRKNESY